MDLSSFAIDGLVPSRVDRPSTTAEVASVIGDAHRAREAVVVHGGGTRIGVGDAPARYDGAVDLRGLTGIVEHSAPDLVCTVRAGTTIAELASGLASKGQRWPVDVADPERATVGGTIASAAPSPTRLRYQHPRDWVIGCEAVLGDGTVTRAGGRVVKNVTGYDLTRLYSGSFGTLAVITEVSLKLVATDERTATMRFGQGRAGGDGIAATELAAMAHQLRSEAFEAIVFVGGREPALYVRVSGAASVVERLSGSSDSAAAITHEAWSALLARVTNERFVARISVPPGREIDLIAGDAHAYVGTGLAFLFGERSDDELRERRSKCESAGGALVIERASPRQRQSLGTWGTRRTPGRVAIGLKERFDPNGVLAPGRMPLA